MFCEEMLQKGWENPKVSKAATWKHSKSSNTSGLLTRHSMDLSYALQRVMEQRYPGRPLGLLGEHRVTAVRSHGSRVEPVPVPGRAAVSLQCRTQLCGVLAATGAVPVAWRRLRPDLLGACSCDLCSL